MQIQLSKLQLPIEDKGGTLHKMVRPHFKQTKENFETHAMRVIRYIRRHHSFSYFLPSTTDLIVDLIIHFQPL